MKKIPYVLVTFFAVMSFTGCSATVTTNPGGQVTATVATIARTAPGLVKQFNNVYAYLVQQKLVPDHLDAATKALAAMDACAPIVQKGAEALQGDNFNWVSFVLQSVITVAQIMGYILPALA